MAVTVHLDAGLLEVLNSTRRVIAEYNANVWNSVELTANEKK